ncbi:hypothetical protein RRG08_021257 [Elysia crispata]|uniref:Uncharacterized protein n=1 Tax=Elysia crispata TaxID=231223 RepID=A0AAE0YU35_9GAST|nr:hypothetical protein RRG08_021257 [Elysia crispata]
MGVQPALHGLNRYHLRSLDQRVRIFQLRQDNDSTSVPAGMTLPLLKTLFCLCPPSTKEGSLKTANRIELSELYCAVRELHILLSLKALHVKHKSKK